MATADEQVIVDGQRAVAVQQQEGPLIYSGGTTDVQCIVSTSDGPQRAIKVYNVGGWTPEGQTTAYLVQQLLMDKYQTQEVVDATDLVRNTADLNPFILDLSGNTILKKLTATGTDEKVETGLQGVLVSNEAPFDSAISPQINVNYTGLNRTALQNLFNSLPYNVGYTLVGSPTINNGIASGFSSSDYLLFSQKIGDLNTNDFEAVVKINNLYNNHGTFSGICSVCSGNWMAVDNQGHPTFTVSTKKSGESSYSQRAKYDYSYSVGTNDYIWLKFSKTGNVVKLQYALTEDNYSAGVTYTLEEGEEFNPNASAGNLMDYGFGSHPEISVDLNSTYITLNGNRWSAFDGITRRISVVGCTGTADLTAADKAIVENKGWAITLS